MTTSPWGSVQHSESIGNGISLVMTARHGGVRVTKKFADQNFTDNEKSRAIFDGSCYWYEEDCDWAIPFYKMGLWDNDEKKNNIVRTLQAWHPSYLWDIGEKELIDPKSIERMLEYPWTNAEKKAKLEMILEILKEK